MTCVSSLNASAEAFDAVGLAHDAHVCRRLAVDCAAMSDTLGPDAAHALYRNWTTEMAIRATAKTLERVQ